MIRSLRRAHNRIFLLAAILLPLLLLCALWVQRPFPVNPQLPTSQSRESR
jgi:hypothetical protein